jgi:ATP-binding cassette, subfamily B, multidrug efflux pump
MFQLRFTPDFARQKKALLAENVIPRVSLPDSIKTCLASFTEPNPIAAPTPGKVWLESMRAVKPMLFKAALIALAASTCAAISTLAAMQLLRASENLQLMWLLSAIYFAMNATAQVWTYHSGRLRCWVSLGAESHLVSLISRKLLHLSAVAAARQSSGNLKTLITSDVRNVGQFLDNAVRNLLPALTGLAVTTPLLIYFAGRPGLFGLIVMGLALPVSLVLNHISSHYQARSQEELDRLTSLLGEWVKNVRLIRYLSWDEAFRRDVSAGVRRFMSVSVIQHFMACLIFGLSMTWWMVATTGVVLVSEWLNYPLDFIGFFGSLWLLTYLNGYFTHLPNTIRLYGLAAPSVRRIARLLGEEEQSKHLATGEDIESGAVPIAVVFEAVSFQYPSGKSALQNVSLRIALDEQLAIIGEVGSGKTTLLKLLCGEFPPTQGRILVEFEGGQVRDLWTRTAYPLFRRHLAYVPQEAFVSSDLFQMNISLSDEASNGDVVTAAYWAELEADLQALPQGLSQELGESGVNLSGGQRQRLNLARAFYSQREYMVLDDTMSAVDTRTEASLMERLVARGKGFVLVTHRTGELFRVGRILVMKNGSIVEQGDPQLLASEPDSHFNRVLRAYESEPING